MIPPRLAHQLQNLITRKLLESPHFHKLVANVDGTIASLRLGIKEGLQEAEKELSALRNKSHGQPTTSKSDSTTAYSNLKDSQNTSTYRPTPQEQNQARLNTEKKLEELLEKLRRQQPKS